MTYTGKILLVWNIPECSGSHKNKQDDVFIINTNTKNNLYTFIPIIGTREACGYLSIISIIMSYFGMSCHVKFCGGGPPTFTSNSFHVPRVFRTKISTNEHHHHHVIHLGKSS